MTQMIDLFGTPVQAAGLVFHVNGCIGSGKTVALRKLTAQYVALGYTVIAAGHLSAEDYGPLGAIAVAPSADAVQTALETTEGPVCVVVDDISAISPAALGQLRCDALLVSTQRPELGPVQPVATLALGYDMQGSLVVGDAPPVDVTYTWQ